MDLALRGWRNPTAPVIRDTAPPAVDRARRITTPAAEKLLATFNRSIMKSEKKPFVIEFKNRRRHSQKETSIWGRVDLKAAGDEVAAEQAVTDTGVSISMLPSETTPI